VKARSVAQLAVAVGRTGRSLRSLSVRRWTAVFGGHRNRWRGCSLDRHRM